MYDRLCQVMPRPILIIDDNPLNVELVTDLLQASGFQVYSAETAERGVELARELLPSLILMDMQLPGMDGASAAKVLKSDPATQNLTIIGLTADDRKCSNFDGYLAKPIEVRTFVSSIRAFLPEAASEAKASA